DVSAQDVFDPIGREAGDRVPEADHRAFGPSTSPYPWHAGIVETNVKRQADTVGSIAAQPLCDLVGPLDGGTANDHATDPLPQKIVDGCGRPDTAAYLYTYRALRSHAAK